MNEWVKMILNFVFGGLVIGGLLKWWDKHLGKEKESLEVSKMRAEGPKLILEYKTNIDLIVQKETTKLRQDIAELKELYMARSKELYENEIEANKKQAELQTRMNEQQEMMNKQFNFNQHTAEQLQKALAMKEECAEQLAQLKVKLNI